MTGTLRLAPPDADGIARLTLSHPGKRNALSVGMWRALREAVESLPDAARVLLLRGEGGHFAAGADVAEFPGFRFDAESLRHYHEETVAPALAALEGCAIPLVGCLEGNCIGGGLEIAACCDLRIAARDATFGVPVAKLGFPVAPGEVLLLRRAFADALLRELLLEAALLDADAALARGLVHRVADDAGAEAEATARRIAALPTEVARANKRTLRLAAAGALHDPAQRAALYGYAAEHHHVEGITAFLEKRLPSFTKTAK